MILTTIDASNARRNLRQSKHKGWTKDGIETFEEDVRRRLYLAEKIAEFSFRFPVVDQPGR